MCFLLRISSLYRSINQSICFYYSNFRMLLMIEISLSLSIHSGLEYEKNLQFWLLSIIKWMCFCIFFFKQIECKNIHWSLRSDNPPNHVLVVPRHYHGDGTATLPADILAEYCKAIDSACATFFDIELFIISILTEFKMAIQYKVLGISVYLNYKWEID